MRLVKTRLQKTWVLKEGIRDGIDVTSYNSNEELSFSEVSKSTLNIKRPVGPPSFQEYAFKNNKTTIYQLFQNENYEIKITKLTNKELWLEGNGFLGVIGAGRNNIIKVKYNAK